MCSSDLHHVYKYTHTHTLTLTHTHTDCCCGAGLRKCEVFVSVVWCSLQPTLHMVLQRRDWLSSSPLLSSPSLLLLFSSLPLLSSSLLQSYSSHLLFSSVLPQPNHRPDGKGCQLITKKNRVYFKTSFLCLHKHNLWSAYTAGDVNVILHRKFVIMPPTIS